MIRITSKANMPYMHIHLYIRFIPIFLSKSTSNVHTFLIDFTHS